MFKDVFMQLLQTKKISAYKLSADTNIPQSLISNWKKGTKTPSSDNLIKLAKYFDVSIDYLLSNETPEKSEETEKSLQLIELENLCKDMEDNDLKSIIDYINFLKHSTKK